MTGSEIRLFFRELFGSRVAEQLENELLRARNDYEGRLGEKDNIISELKSEKAQLTAEIILYRTKAGLPSLTAIKKPSFAMGPFAAPMKSSWQIEQEKHDAENARLDAEEAAKKEKVNAG